MRFAQPEVFLGNQNFFEGMGSTNPTFQNEAYNPAIRNEAYNPAFQNEAGNIAASFDLGQPWMPREAQQKINQLNQIPNGSNPALQRKVLERQGLMPKGPTGASLPPI